MTSNSIFVTVTLFIRIVYEFKTKSEQMLKLLYFSLVASFLPSCFGRIDDVSVANRNSGPLAQLADLRLASGKPQIVIFGAGWCKPCRNEIGSLNSLHERFSDRVDFVSYLVEGNTKGSSPDSEALKSFDSPNGEVPKYSLLPDTNWNIFNAFLASDGQTLPLTVFLNASGTVVEQRQSSMNLERDLVPALERLLSQNESNTAPETPSISDPEPGTTPLPSEAPGNPGGPKTKHSNSVVIRKLKPEYIERLKESWKMGISEQGFSREEMAFEAGTSFLNVALATDADWPEDVFVLSTRWTSNENFRCWMTVKVTVDGSFVSSDGACPP